jgi:hypothetical protein
VLLLLPREKLEEDYDAPSTTKQMLWFFSSCTEGMVGKLLSLPYFWICLICNCLASAALSFLGTLLLNSNKPKLTHLAVQRANSDAALGTIQRKSVRGRCTLPTRFWCLYNLFTNCGLYFR